MIQCFMVLLEGLQPEQDLLTVIVFISVFLLAQPGSQDEILLYADDMMLFVEQYTVRRRPSSC